MAAAIPVRMRERVIRLFERGEVSREVAAELGVSESGARRVLRRFAERGTLEPKVGKTGPKSGLTDEVAVDLRARVAADPDATIAELLEGTGVVGRVPGGHWATTTVVCAVRLAGRSRRRRWTGRRTRTASGRTSPRRCARGTWW